MGMGRHLLSGDLLRSFGQKAHCGHLVLSRHASQTRWESNIRGRCSNTLSMAWVMGMLRALAIRRRVRDDLWDSSEV
jgi:hypothetical protein